MNAALIKQGRATPAPLRPPELQGDPCSRRCSKLENTLFSEEELKIPKLITILCVIMIREKVCLDLG